MAAALAMPAAAVTPTYELSEEYKSGKYYEQLLEYELTGDMRRDVLSIAFTQLGYHEGNSDADMDGRNILGARNFVEYNRIWGKLDNGEGNGKSYGYAWCAAFVTWCLRQAQVPEEIAAGEISCSRMTAWYRSNSTYRTRGSGYTPIPGDIVMFQYNGSGSANHVGFVIGVEGGQLYTIEGNSGGMVGTHSYSLSNGSILGYCVPDYTVEEGAVYDFPLEATACLPGDYYTTPESLNVRSGPATSYTKLGELPQGSSVTVTECEGEWGKIDFAGREAWISMSYVISAEDFVYAVTYDDGEGQGAPTTQRKTPGEELTLSDVVPTQRGYTFVGWATERLAEEPDYQPGDTYTVDADLTLYALWEPDTYTLTLTYEDGTVWQTFRFDFGEKVTLPAETPTMSSDGEYRYTFAGWNATIPQYLRGDTTRVATFTAEVLTEEEREAYLAELPAMARMTAAVGEDVADVSRDGGTAIVIAVVISLFLLTTCAALALAILKIRRQKLAEIAAVAEEVDGKEKTSEKE